MRKSIIRYDQLRWVTEDGDHAGLKKSSDFKYPACSDCYYSHLQFHLCQGVLHEHVIICLLMKSTNKAIPKILGSDFVTCDWMSDGYSCSPYSVTYSKYSLYCFWFRDLENIIKKKPHSLVSFLSCSIGWGLLVKIPKFWESSCLTVRLCYCC